MEAAVVEAHLEVHDRVAGEDPAVEGLLDADQHIVSRSHRLAQPFAPVQPDAVVVRDRTTGFESGPLACAPHCAVQLGLRLGGVLGRLAGEGEVQACAVQVAVAGVCRRCEATGHVQHRGHGRLVRPCQNRPRTRHLHGVDDEAGADQRLERTDVVAVPEPLFDQSGIELSGVAALGVDDGPGGGHDLGVGLVENDQDVEIVDVEVPTALRVVVQADDGGCGAAVHDAPACVEPLLERGEPEGPTKLGSRPYCGHAE